MKKRLTLTLLFLLGTITLTLGQGDPGPLPGGDCNDPDACPLDTWVIAFAVITLIVTTLYLRRRQTATL